MEEQTPEEFSTELKTQLFNSVEYGDSENAKSLIGTYGARFPELINAVATINIPIQNNQQRKLTTPLLPYILRCAKHEFSKKDETKEAELLDLAQFVLDQPDCNILGLDSDRNTALHHAIWYIYPEIVISIVTNAQRKGCVKQICTIKNNFGEKPIYVLFRALRVEGITIEDQAKLKHIQVSLSTAEKQETKIQTDQRLILNQTTAGVFQDFYESFPDIVQDELDKDYAILDRPVSLPSGHTVSEKFFTNPANKNPNIDPYSNLPFTSEEPKIPHVLARNLLEVYLEYEKTEDKKTNEHFENFFAHIQSLLYCPITNQPFIYKESDNFYIIAQSTKVNNINLLGRTCTKTAIKNIKEDIKIYLDVFIKDFLEFIQKYNDKLIELAKSAEEQAKQSSVVVPDDEITLLASTSTPMATEKSATVEIYDINISELPDHMRITGTKAKVFKLYSTIEYLQTIDNYLYQNIIERFNYDKIQCARQKDHIVITISDDDKATMSKVEKFFVEHEKLLTQEQIQQGGTIITGLPVNPHRSNVSPTQPPKANPVVFSNIPSPKPTFPKPIEIKHQPLQTKNSLAQAIPAVFSNVPSHKAIFPKPIEIKYQPLQTRSDSGQIVVSYNPKNVSQIAAAIKQLDVFANIKQSGNNILIKISSKQPDQTKTGIFLIKEGQQDMLYIKFPNQETMNSFITIFDLESYISQYPNDNEIKIDPYPFQQQTTMQQKAPTCSVM